MVEGKEVKQTQHAAAAAAATSCTCTYSDFYNRINIDTRFESTAIQKNEMNFSIFWQILGSLFSSSNSYYRI